MSNSLDPDHAPHFVGPDLGSICLQRLTADNKRLNLRLLAISKYDARLSIVLMKQYTFIYTNITSPLYIEDMKTNMKAPAYY